MSLSLNLSPVAHATSATAFAVESSSFIVASSITALAVSRGKGTNASSRVALAVAQGADVGMLSARNKDGKAVRALLGDDATARLARQVSGGQYAVALATVCADANYAYTYITNTRADGSQGVARADWLRLSVELTATGNKRHAGAAALHAVIQAAADAIREEAATARADALAIAQQEAEESATEEAFRVGREAYVEEKRQRQIVSFSEGYKDATARADALYIAQQEAATVTSETTEAEAIMASLDSVH